MLLGYGQQGASLLVTDAGAKVGLRQPVEARQSFDHSPGIGNMVHEFRRRRGNTLRLAVGAFRSLLVQIQPSIEDVLAA
jgi:hypothetical protein